MAVWDLVILESGNGGDLTLLGNDLAVCKGIETNVYLRMFGGNVQANTVFPRPDEDESYWLNSLSLSQLPAAQFNSLTERTLKNTELTSVGRGIIENAIKKDMEGLASSVSVSIVSTDKINVTLKILLSSGSEKIVTFSLVRNPNTGDFDLNDFDFRDFK